MLRANYRKYQGGWAWLSWAIPAAAKLVSGMMGQRSAEKQSEANIAQQRDFAQHGIQWRVDDAARAGVSPLYAMGAQTTSFAPQGVFDAPMAKALEGMGQDVGSGLHRENMYKEGRALRMAQLASIEAQTKESNARADLALSQAARLRQLDQNSSAFGNDVVVGAYRDSGPLTSHPLYADAVKLTPDEMVSRSSKFEGETAGREHPSMRQFSFPGGYKALLPATGQGGIPEDIDASMLPLVVGANVERYGWRWLIDTLGYITGRSPDDRRRLGSLEGFIRRKLKEGTLQVPRGRAGFSQW